MCLCGAVGIKLSQGVAEIRLVSYLCTRFGKVRLIKPAYIMKTNIFSGVGTALITPFRTDGAVDEQALCRLVDEQAESGVDFLCVLGTTAETPTLTHAERRRVVEIIRDGISGRLPLLIGAGGNDTTAVCEAVKALPDGVDGVLSVVPYYNKPSQEGLFRHFQAVAGASPVPVVLYNVPGRTGVNMTAETTLRIARECNNVVAIKEASGDIAQIAAVIEGAPADFCVLSGDDALAVDLIKQGACGVISVISNAYPRFFSRMIHAALSEQWEEVEQCANKLRPFYKPLFADGNPSGIKQLLAFEGKCENILRLPLVPVGEETAKQLAGLSLYMK